MGEKTVPTEFCMMDLAELYESPTNPRRHFEGLEELTENVKQHGVLTPLLVRAKTLDKSSEAMFEIIAGARRFRAAHAAKVRTIPVRIMEMTDEQAVELQLIDNLQRQDVHPIDEALGYKRLIDMGRTVEEIAAKVNKSASYVYQRLKLSALVPAAQDLFLDDKISAGHAVQIARLQPVHQKETVAWMKRTDCSVRELAQHIENNFHLRLQNAAFPTDDAALLAEAGACKDCPKRSGANPLLFPDVKAKDTCSDPMCYHAKEAAYVQIQLTAHPDALVLTVGTHYQKKPQFETAWTKLQGKKCEYTTQAVVGEVLEPYDAQRQGIKLGQVIEVCTNLKCKVHHAVEGGRSDYNSRTGGSRKAEKARKLEAKRQCAIFQALMLRPPIYPTQSELKQQLAWALENLSADAARLICQAMGWEVKPDKFKQRNWSGRVVAQLREPKSIPQTLYVLATVMEMWRYGGGGIEAAKAKPLEEFATKRGVNVKAISKAVRDAAAKKKKPAKVGKVKAKKPTKVVTKKAKKAA